MFPLRGGLGPLTLASKAPVLAWWLSVTGKTPVVAYAAKDAATLADSYINLVTPGTKNAAPGTAPTWDATNGWKFDGSSQYLTTGTNANAIMTMIVRFSGGNVAGYGGVMGQYISESSAVSIHPYHNAGGVVYYAGGSGGVVKAPKLAAGVLGVAGANGYRDGVFDVDIPGSGTRPNSAITIGKAGASYYGGYVQAAIMFVDTLSAGEMLTISAAMAAL